MPMVLTAAADSRESLDPPSGVRVAGLAVPPPDAGDLRAGAETVHEPLVQLAQAVDPRVAQLEEQVRRLTGMLEELNFQILQMQDQLRRMQEDNEQRFQEIEQRRSQGPGAGQRDHARDDGPPAVDDGDFAALPPLDGGSPQVGQPPLDGSSRQLGQPPRTFGTITFDENGNFRGAGIPGGQSQGEPRAGQDDTTVAALPPGGGDADELYRNSYQFILSGDYGTAESGFRELIDRYPDGEHAADAHFWLGEALLAQGKPREAAETFLTASRSFPNASKAPDTLFKLGVALAALDQRGVACATFAEVGQRFPQASGALKERVRQEQARISC